MTNESSLILLDRAAVLVAQANTIQAAKELQDKFLTVADWAKRRDSGEEVIKAAKACALEAERKMGQMLLETERAKGAQGIGKSAVPKKDSTPTLTDLGLTRKQSAEAQALATMPAATFQAVKSGKKTITKAIAETKPQKPTKPKPAAPEPEEGPTPQEINAELQEEIEGQERLIESLMKNDLAKELVIQKGKFDALNGRMHQVLTTEAEAKRTAKYRGELLASIRRALDVETDAQIIPAIKTLKK